MLMNLDRKFKLGMHSYTLHLNGCGQNWGFVGDYRDQKIDIFKLMDLAVGWQLDGLHITNVDLQSHEPEQLAKVKKAAEDHGLYLEFNCSLDEEFDPRLNETFEDAAWVAEQIGAKVVKFSLDIRRPKPLYGSQFHPDVMRQLCDVVDKIKAALPEYERTGIRLAVENHTETFADEIIWVVEQVGHPLCGACLDNINSFSVLESPEYSDRVLAPYTYCVHFCDNILIRDQDGAHFKGVALGTGDVDCKKTLLQLQRAPECLDCINFEVEWEIGQDTLDVAQEKELKACEESIKYLREELGLGLRGR